MTHLDFSLAETSTDSASGALQEYRSWRRTCPDASFAVYVGENEDLSRGILIELATTDLIQQILSGRDGRAEEYITAIPGISSDVELVLDLIDAELCAKSDQGPPLDKQSMLERFPQYASHLKKIFDVHILDVEASKGNAAQGLGPIAVPGYKLVRRINDKQVDDIQIGGKDPHLFELWEATHLKSLLPMNIVIWEATPNQTENTRQLLEKRKELQHPNIVELIDFGFVEVEDGKKFVYAIVRSLSGKTMIELLDHPMTDQLRESTIAEWLLKVMEARSFLKDNFGYALSVSPEEIFIDYENNPMLIDFVILTNHCEQDALQLLGLLMFSICLQEVDSSEVKEHLAAGYEPIRLNEVKESISKKLNAIYLSCVHPNTKRRYTDSSVAIEDLKRFKAGESLKASKLQKRWLWF